jgi:CheY-like chemotaxis protein
MESKARQLSVLLVEDEALIRMMIADMVEELGHSVVAEAGDIADALKLAETVDFGIALLDSDLRGIDPVAAIINERRLPSSLPAVMARLACRKNFATDRCCKSHF